MSKLYAVLGCMFKLRGSLVSWTGCPHQACILKQYPKDMVWDPYVTVGCSRTEVLALSFTKGILLNKPLHKLSKLCSEGNNWRIASELYTTSNKNSNVMSSKFKARAPSTHLQNTALPKNIVVRALAKVYKFKLFTCMRWIILIPLYFSRRISDVIFWFWSIAEGCGGQFKPLLLISPSAPLFLLGQLVPGWSFVTFNYSHHFIPECADFSIESSLVCWSSQDKISMHIFI